MARTHEEHEDDGRKSEETAAESAFPAPESLSMELVKRIQGGERAAWNELYARYHDQLLLAARLRLGPGLRRHLTSEDVFQSVALEAFRALERFEYRGPGSLETWLRTLVLNKIRDRADTFGAQKRAGDVALDDALASSLAEPAPAYHDGARYERLERALAELEPVARELLLLRKLEGLSSKEAAARLGLSDDAARKAYSRALARLATRMGGRDAS
ncbi:MAG: sigma-70 family RNA polymerase sigma factor [Planctomycetota bacterium]